MGNESFEMVYKAAQFISSGAEHARLRKCMDAVDGKENDREMRKRIGEKRNKDTLMNYYLLPVRKPARTVLLERYQYLLQFLNESKAYGSQRQESEKKAVEMAMQNLAQNAGYPDVTRLVWNMETALFKKQIAPYLVPKEKEGVKVYIKVNEEGQSHIQYVKAGRGVLNNIPAKLRKDPYIAELKEANKKLKNPYLHSADRLEQAMGEGSLFPVSEWQKWRQHPVLGALLKYLIVSMDEGMTGFFTKEGLQTPAGEMIPASPSSDIRIAHPIHLFRTGELEAYRQYISRQGITQPFEQVSRKFYLKTEENAGMQCPLPMTWASDGAGGRQKVCYCQNIIACVRASGRLAFLHRKTLQPLLLAEVPDSIFSEALRDILYNKR
jgi:hypothetical protein